jgi:MoaA/NifB/PqqE/SkfB family radical SAM enzyme
LGKLFEYYQLLDSLIHGKPRAKGSRFCYYPFMQVLMTANGQYKPCCKYEFPLTHQGRTLEVTDGDSPEDAWNSDSLQQLRHELKHHIAAAGCTECWREEAMQVRSMRYDSFDYLIPKKQITNPQFPIRLEINASNVCNLKCRICSSFASTKWQQEEIALFGKASPKHINLTENNLASIKKWLPYVEEIGLFGGEPFLSDENMALLQYCVDEQLSNKMTILVNTNGTVYNDKIVQLLKQFKKVYLNFSIDDIGRRFEYQRKGAKWEDVTENMKRFIRHGGYSKRDKIECKINCTLSIFNIYYMPEYFAYMNKHFRGLPVFWNLLYNPVEFSVQILPEEVRKRIQNRINEEVRTTYTTASGRTKNLEMINNYLKQSDDKAISLMFEAIERNDLYRKEVFREVFPEFNAIIEAYR